MKKLTLILFSCLYFCFGIFAQETIKPIKIKLNPNKGSLCFDEKKLNEIKKGQFYQLIINDINTSLYKISINNKDTSTSEALSFPTFASLPIDALTSAIAGLNDIGGKVGIKSILEPQSMELAFQTLNEIQISSDKVNRNIEQIKKIEKELRRNTAEPFLLEINEILNNSLSILQSQKNNVDNALLEIYRIHLNNQVISQNKLFGMSQEPQKIIESIFRTRNTLDSLSSSIALQYSNYRFTTKNENIAKIIKEFDDLKELDAQIKKSFDEFESAIQKVKEPINGENFLKLSSLLIPSLNNQNKYKSLPIQFSEEETTLEIKISPRHQNMGLSDYYTKIKFPINRKNFWGLSSGIFIGIPADEAFSIRSNISATDTTFSLIEENPGKLEIGFNTMIRGGRKVGCSDNTYWHFGLGPGITVSNNIRPRFLIGTGLGFGEKNIFLLDVGLITGYYDVLSNVFDEGNLNNLPVMPTDVMVSQLRAGAYFSISYLFLK